MSDPERTTTGAGALPHVPLDGSDRSPVAPSRPEAAGNRRRPHAPARNHIDGDQRNVMAFMALVCGICSWVPLVVLFAAPLTLIFALLAYASLFVQGRRRGIGGAHAGLVLATIAVILQTLVFASASVVGFIGA